MNAHKVEASSSACPGAEIVGVGPNAGDENEAGVSMLDELEDVQEEHEYWREWRGGGEIDSFSASAERVPGVVSATVGMTLVGVVVVVDEAVSGRVAPGTGGVGLWVLPSAKSHSAARYSGRGSSGTVS